MRITRRKYACLVWLLAMAKTSQYYVTESEVSKLLAQSGLPPLFQQLFARDYVSLKSDATSSSDQIGVIFERLDANDANINSNTTRITVIEGGLSDHIDDNSAHGASGSVIGAEDYAQASVGGTVYLASAVANSPASAVSAVLNPNTAPAVYSQADAATWVAMLNEHKATINQLTADLNSLIVLFNASLSSERSAKQRAT